MATTAATPVITTGLFQIQVADIAVDGDAGTQFNKIGKVFEGTCKVSHDKADQTAFNQEGHASPEFVVKKRKMPTIEISLMLPSLQTFADYVGGTITGDGSTTPFRFGMDGTEEIAEKTIKVVHKSGLTYLIPRADLEGVLADEASDTGQLLVNITITPLAPKKTGVKAFQVTNQTAEDLTPVDD